MDKIISIMYKNNMKTLNKLCMQFFYMKYFENVYAFCVSYYLISFLKMFCVLIYYERFMLHMYEMELRHGT